MTTVDEEADPTNVPGQYVFFARLDDGSSGIYRMEPDGKITELFKSGTKTELGMISLEVRGGSQGLAVNSKGQIATVVSIDGGPDTVILLTPTSP